MINLAMPNQPFRSRRAKNAEFQHPTLSDRLRAYITAIGGTPTVIWGDTYAFVGSKREGRPGLHGITFDITIDTELRELAALLAYYVNHPAPQAPAGDVTGGHE